MNRTLTGLSLVTALVLSLGAFAADNDRPYRIEDSWLTLNDGTRLAVTYYIPNATNELKQFPVLLEMLPYRKDDIAKAWAHPLYDYFARQGLALAKVDVRGTGSSEGTTPSREYSAQEIDDAVEVIALLSAQSFANGNIGMWGISWGGFNAIQTALRNPPQLKAILAAHASDDLYSNDVHYTDGIFGIDEYILSINHMTGFMSSPDYTIDETYFANRFDQTPWLFTYLKHNEDGPFWRDGSLKHQIHKLEIPTYLIGGLLDGYRDTLPNTLQSSHAPVRAVLGPWPHAWPDSASPGPTWEWRADAASWWHAQLGDEPKLRVPYDENDFRVFVRSGNAPDPALTELSGHWYNIPWPMPESSIERLVLYPQADSALDRSANNAAPATMNLLNTPSTGIELGEWWGELLPDMAAIDRDSLVFDSSALESELTLIGMPEVNLLASSNSSDGNWVVRLEDVAPDGSVALITGGAINGQLRQSTLTSQPIQPNQKMALTVPLRMTTWTFQPGHKIRLAINNAAFPMFWPSATATASELDVNIPATKLTLPIWRSKQMADIVPMDSAKPSNYLGPEIIALGPVPGRPRNREVIEDAANNSVSLIRESGVEYQLRGARLEATRHTRHTVQNENPANTEFEGWAEYLLDDGRASGPVRYRTEIQLTSDEETFDLKIIRVLSGDAGEIRRRQWQGKIPRGVH